MVRSRLDSIGGSVTRENAGLERKVQTEVHQDGADYSREPGDGKC